MLALLGLAVIAVAVAHRGWQAAGVALAGLLAVIVGVAIFQVACAVTRMIADNRSAYRNVHRAERQVAESEDHYVDVLWRILRYSEGRSKYTQGHSERVAGLSERIGRQMRLGEGPCNLLHQAGRLHDIGMLAVPDQILADRGTLSGAGYRTVRRHCEVAYEILRPLRSLAPVLPAVRHHHERMNGTGYPGGLAGDSIPLEARILAVADAYDAMTHDRPHRPAMAPLTALAELQRCCPSGYDPQCVRALAEALHLPKLADALAAV